jgi:DNA-binding response OmpR family regulator
VTASGKKSLLLVDDSDFLVFCYVEYLSAQDYFVEAATSVDEAFKKLQSLNPDLVILEIGIGGTAGVGFLKHLLGEDGKLMWPVVVHTLRPEMEEFCRNIGVEEFLLKTGYGAPLLTAIQSVFARRAAAVKVEAEVEAEPGSSPAPSQGGVILAEDEPVIVENIRRTLASAGYGITLALNAEDVLEKAESTRPVGILLKEVLTGTNGRAIAARLEESDTLRQIPVILYDNTRGLDEARRWKKVPRNVKAVLFTDEAALLLEAIEKNCQSGA